MLNKLLLTLLFIVLCVSNSRAIVGDSCTNPAIATLCGSGNFKGSVNSFTNNVSTWHSNSTTVNANGNDIYYQINLPVSAYQPVKLSASFAGYFNAANKSNTVYFLWFEKSPCATDTASFVSSYNLSGTSAVHDSTTLSYLVTNNSSSQYYLVIDFANAVSANYSYSLQLGFTDNEPPPPANCTANPAPFKGLLQPDTSSCFTSAPYHLPISELGGSASSFALNQIPQNHTADLTYLPVSDSGKNGFVISLNNNLYPVQNQDVFIAFNKSSYIYSDLNNDYTVGITVFMKNDGGIEGLKGFKIQVPGAVMTTGDFQYPASGDKGTYNSSGRWNAIIDPTTSTSTWIFNSLSGKGDNASSGSYGCKVYTFSVHVMNLGDTIKAWYLADNYGNDSLNCPRADCSDKLSPGWISLGGSNFIPPGRHPNCPTPRTFECQVGIQEMPCGDYLPSTTCGIYLAYGQTFAYLFLPNGCYDIINGDWDLAYPEYTSPALNSSDIIDTLCPGSYYDMEMDYSFSYYNQTVLVYQDSMYYNSFYPVDMSGNVLYGQSYYDGDLPVYPQNNFHIHLTNPGKYFIASRVCDPSLTFGFPCIGLLDCLSPSLTLSYYPALTVNVNTDTLICSGQSVTITASGGSSYQWTPNYAINTTSGPVVTVNPPVETTYTVTDPDRQCNQSPAIDVNVQVCTPQADFTVDKTSICKGGIIHFTNTSTSATQWQWLFPGGVPAQYNGQNPPAINYAAAGTYSVTLIVSNNYGSDTTTNSSFPIVVDTCSLRAAFSISTDSICQSDCITVSNFSTGNIVSCQWRFPGATPGTSNSANPPQVCYANKGSYQIALIINDGVSIDSANQTITISNCSPTASFTLPKDSICKNDCINYTNTSSANATQWKWNFPGGNPSSYSGQTPPAICYANTGNFSVQLIASNNYGTDTATQQVVVYKYNAGNIKALTDTLCEYADEDLTVDSTWGALQWQSADSTLQFTDLARANGTSHHIVAPLAKNYFRVIAGTGNCADTTNMVKINIKPALYPYFSYKISGDSVSFNPDSSQGYITGYQWSLKQGVESFDRYPTYVYPAKDTVYNVCLTINDGLTCTAVFCRPLPIIYTPLKDPVIANTLKIYPDPFSNYLLIDGQGMKIKSIELFDVLGRSVFESKINLNATGTLKIDASTLHNGMFYVKITTENDGYIQRVVRLKD